MYTTHTHTHIHKSTCTCAHTLIKCRCKYIRLPKYNNEENGEIHIAVLGAKQITYEGVRPNLVIQGLVPWGQKPQLAIDKTLQDKV